MSDATTLLLFANSDWFHYRFNSGLIERAVAAGFEPLLVSPNGPHVTDLRARGWRWAELDLDRRGTNPLREHALLRRARRLYEAERPGVSHHFTLKSCLMGSLAARRAGVKRIVNSITGLGYVYSSRAPRARLLRPLIDRLCRRAFRGTAVVFLNRDDRDQFLQRRLVTATSAHLIPGCGVDVELFRPAPEPNGEPPLVVLPARMLWSKGVGEFVAAAEELKRRRLAARFALVGTTDPDNPGSIPTERLASWHAGGMVEWWGFRSDMPSVYDQAAIVCLPALFREGAPTTLMEAAASGRPVVASDVPGCRDSVIHDATGLLVAPGDVARLAAALADLLENPEKRARFGVRGRELALERFSAEAALAATLRLYGPSDD